MANLLSILRRRPDEIARLSQQELLAQLAATQLYPGSSTLYSVGRRPVETVPNSYLGYAQAAYASCTVVGACMRVRRDIFSQARFTWRELTDDGSGTLSHDEGLSLLDRPWPNGTTGQLLTKMITDVDLCGNAYIVNDGDRLRWRRPDWMFVVLSGDPNVDDEVDVLGYVYTPGGCGLGEGKPYTVAEVAHWAPIPRPGSEYIGMSWMTSALTEIQADKHATDHKLNFFVNGATLGPVYRLPATMTVEQFKKFRVANEQAHVGVENAYRPLYIGGGAEVTLSAATFQQLELKATQGAGETRIASNSGIHPTIAALSEGLQGSSLNAGNFTAARRLVADITLHKLWQDACDTLASFVEVPDGKELWIRERAIPFLREDAKDAAEIFAIDAQSATVLVREGYEPESVTPAVAQRNILLLEHSGALSVQLQEPGAQPDQRSQVIDGEVVVRAIESELSRRFDPSQPRDTHGRWSLTGAAIAALKALGGEPGAVNFDPDDPEGRYFDWSVHDPKTGTYSFEAGGDGDSVQLDLNEEDMTRLYSALSVTHLREDQSQQHSPAVTALLAAGKQDAVNFSDGGYADWSVRDANGFYQFEVSDGNESVQMDLTSAELARLMASLALSTQPDESTRALIWALDEITRADWNPAEHPRNPRGGPGGGRFRSVAARILDALEAWAHGDGDDESVLKDFTQPQLKKAVEARGLTPKYRASAADLRKQLLDDVREKIKAGREGKHRRFTITVDGRKADVGVFTDPHTGKVSLHVESDAGRPGRRVSPQFATLGELSDWARHEGHTEIADYANEVPDRTDALAAKVAPKAPDQLDLDKLRKLDDPEAIRDALDLHKVPELKQALRDEKLPLSGRKRELVDRLVEHLHGRTDRPAAKSPGSAVATTPPGTLSEDELVALKLLSAQGWFTDGGWVNSTQVTAMHRHHLDALAEKGLIQKHVAPTGDKKYRIDPRSVGTQMADAGEGAALVGDVLPANRTPEPRLSLTKVHTGAILDGYRDPGDPSAFGNVPSDGSADPTRVMRFVVQRVEPVDENGNPATGLKATHRRIVGHDTATGARVTSDPVPGGSYWSWLANPDADAVSPDIEGEIVPDRASLAAAKRTPRGGEPMSPDQAQQTDQEILASARAELARLEDARGLSPQQAGDRMMLANRERARLAGAQARIAAAAPPPTDPQELARWRFAQVEAVRDVAESLSMLDELTHNEASARAVQSRLRSAGYSMRPEVVAELTEAAGMTRDRAKVAAAIDRVEAAHGLTRIGNTGATAIFDPTRHEVIGPSPRPGERVEVIAPGYSVTLSNGETVQLSKAKVSTYDPKLHGPEPVALVDAPTEAGGAPAKPLTKRQSGLLARADRAVNGKATVSDAGDADARDLHERGLVEYNPSTGSIELTARGQRRAAYEREVAQSAPEVAKTPHKRAPGEPRPSGLPDKPTVTDFEDLAFRISEMRTEEQRHEILTDLNAAELNTLARQFPGDPAVTSGGMKTSDRRTVLKIPAGLSLEDRRRWLAKKLSGDAVPDLGRSQDADEPDVLDLIIRTAIDENLTTEDLDFLYAAMRHNEAARAAGADITPGHDQLHHYWTVGEGRAKWSTWRELVAHLVKHVGLLKAKIFASRWFIETHGYAAGSDKNRVAHGKPPRGHRVGPG